MVHTKNDVPPVLHDPKVPKFPVVKSKPSFNEVWDNVSSTDYTQSLFVSITSLPLGYFLGRHFDPLLARRTMYLSGAIGSIGGVLLAYQNSALRLQGFGRNDDEVRRYGLSSDLRKNADADKTP